MIIVTGLYAFFSLLLWCETKKSVVIARDSAESGRRAWVYVDNITNVPEDQTDATAERFVGRLTFKNIGNSPAIRSVIAVGTPDELPTGNIGDLDMSDPDYAGSAKALSPGETTFLRVPGTRKHFERGRSEYVIGQIIYYDVFNRQRLTPICLEVRYPTLEEKPGPTFKVGYQACRDHNRMR